MDEIRSSFGKKERSSQATENSVRTEECEHITMGCMTLIINKGRTDLSQFID